MSQSQHSQGLSSQALISTQELDGYTFDLLSSAPDDSICGRLFPLVSVLKSIELKKSEKYTFGRDPHCTEQFKRIDFQALCNRAFMTLSFKHFIIEQRPICSGSSGAVITDLSSNGTYLNGQRIGKNNTKVLSHNDVIALLNPAFEVYMYSDAKITENSEIPVEVRRDYAISRQLLGTGSQGQVYLCINKTTAEHCAIKKIKKADNKSVLNEVHILKKLKHSHIVHMLKHIDTPSAVYIVMEFMACDLAALLIERKYLEEAETKLVFHQVTQAVEYLHNNRVIHRDLKPENILLVSRDSLYIKLTDFGLSKHNTTLTNPDTFCGTPAFLAPEIIKLLRSGSGPYDERVDVWSMGVLLFLCLSGTQPFQSLGNENRLTRILRGRYSFHDKRWQVISYEARTLITAMLTVDPVQRISIPNIHRHPWISQDTDLESQLAGLYSSVKVQI